MVTLGEISDALRAEWGTYRPGVIAEREGLTRS
jgi:hypothetical protein